MRLSRWLSLIALRPFYERQKEDGSTAAWKGIKKTARDSRSDKRRERHGLKKRQEETEGRWSTGDTSSEKRPASDREQRDEGERDGERERNVER